MINEEEKQRAREKAKKLVRDVTALLKEYDDDKDAQYDELLATGDAVWVFVAGNVHTDTTAITSFGVGHWPPDRLSALTKAATKFALQAILETMDKDHEDCSECPEKETCPDSDYKPETEPT